MTITLLIDAIGWAGALALLIAYVLVSARRLDGDSITYQLLNAVGAVFLIVNTAYYGAYPSAFLNLVWTGIALATLVHVRRKSVGGT